MPHGFAGVISLVVDGDAGAAGRVCERTKVFSLAVSLGIEDCDELIADLARALPA
jgi:cystathionine beta-lyase/cystathionine gamma-synthase